VKTVSDKVVIRAFIGLCKMIGGRRALLPEILGQTGPVGAKSPMFDVFLHIAPQP